METLKLVQAVDTNMSSLLQVFLLVFRVECVDIIVPPSIEVQTTNHGLDQTRFEKAYGLKVTMLR